MGGERRVGRSRRGRGARRLAAGLAAMFVMGVLPAVAGAADYCVAPKTGCAHDVDSFETALDKADEASDADRVLLGAGTYTAPTVSGYDYSQPYPVEIIGEGTGQTTLTGPTGASGVIALYGGADSLVRDLTIRLPQNAAALASGLATDTTARRIEVVEDPIQTNHRFGVNLDEYGGTLEDSSVTLNSAQQTVAVELGQSGTTARRSALSARIAVESRDGGTIERSRLTAGNTGVLAHRNLTAISGSLIRFNAAGGAGNGIRADTTAGFNTSVHADGVTIVGPGAGVAYTDGVSAGNDYAPAESVEISLANAIIRGASRPLYAETSGAGQATVSAYYSDYDPAGNESFGANAHLSEANVSNVGDAGFVDAAGGDYHLLATSPLVDAGDPATLQSLDLDGKPLVADGNGDGTARRDLGAFELQPTPAGGGQPPAGGGPVADTEAPLVSGFKAAPALFAVARGSTPLAAGLARGTRFRYTVSENARVTLTIRSALPGRRAGGRCVRPTARLRHARRCTRYRTIAALRRFATSGPNSTRFTGRIGSRALRPGRYRAVIRAADAAGNRSAPRAARVRIARS